MPVGFSKGFVTLEKSSLLLAPQVALLHMPSGQHVQDFPHPHFFNKVQDGEDARESASQSQVLT